MDIKSKLLIVLLILGMADSLFLTYEHFNESPSALCTFGESLSCDTVNRSPYSNLDGISYLLTFDLGLSLPYVNISGINPVFDLMTSNAFLGFLTLSLILAMYVSWLRRKEFLFIDHKDILKYSIAILGFGVFFGFYLFLIMHFVLKSYCLFCILLDFVLISSLLILVLLNKNIKKGKNQ